MLRLRQLLALLLLASFAAGCGSSNTSASSSGGGGGVPDGAAQVPAAVQIFGTVDSSFGDQWDAFNALVDRFPARGQAIDAIHKSLASDGVDFDKDIKATVGPEVDIAAWNLGQAHPIAVGLTQPKDKDGFVKALEKGSNPAAHTEVDGWLVFGSTQADLDAFKALGGGKLGDDKTFEDAMGALPKSTLGRIYVNGAGLQEQLQARLKSSRMGPLGSLGTGSGKLVWAAGAIEALDDGMKLDAVVKTSGGKASNFDASLLEKVPANAFAVLAFDGSKGSTLGAQLKSLQSNPQAGAATAQLQGLLGVGTSDLAGLVSGKGVVYVRAGTLIPEITILEQGIDTKKAVATLDTLAGRLSGVTHATPESVTIEGEHLRQLTASPLTIVYGAVDGTLVVTTSPLAIGELKGGGSKLLDADAFKKIEASAGVKASETSGLFYLDVPNAFAMAQAVAGLARATVPPSVRANVENLRGLLVTAHADDKDTTHITALLGVEPGKPVPATHAGTSGTSTS